MTKYLLILPGFSLKNKQWAEDVSKNMPQFEATIWQWKHWGTRNNADFSLQEEVTHIITQLRESNSKKVQVIAKSIGTFVLTKIIKQSPELFDKIILCGIPLNDLDTEEWNEYDVLKTDSSKAICFQNSADPHGSFAQVSKFFAEKNIQIPMVKRLADNHDYCYSSDFISFLSA